MPVAETIGVVGSIIAIVQISKTIISLCQFYIDAVNGASSDLRVIFIEVSALKGVAKCLQFLTQPNVASSGVLDQLAGATASIEGCKKALEELETLFPPTAASVKGHRSKRQKLDAAVAVLAWPLKAGKAKKLLHEIIQHKTTINLALTAEFVYDLKDVKQKTEQIQDLLTASERATIYTWLEATNPSSIHNRSQRLYEPGTGSWMLRTPQWPLWIEGKQRCLWIHGIPGAGKSILASYLAEVIEKHCTSSSNEVSNESRKLGHAYYYCYFGHNQDESSHFLRWVIGQLCRQSAKVPNELQNIYKSGKTPTLSALLSILHHTVEGFQRVYLVLDAVDESMPRADLLRVIRDLSTDARFSALGLLVTSRQYIDIEQVLESCSAPITMSNPFVEEDIRTLVHATVQSDAKYQRWPEDVRREMLDTIPRKAKGMFRWAVCQLDVLRRLRPDALAIRAALSNLPKTLDETYERIFLEIPGDDWLSVQHVFHWLAYHNELFGTNIPLGILLQAVQQSTLGCLSDDADPLHDFEDLRERCGCLIMVEQGEKCTDEQESCAVSPQRRTVSFAHYTVKEYLQSPRIIPKRVGFFALAQDKIQKHLAAVVFRQALAIQPGSFANHDEQEDSNSIHEFLDTHFNLYCGVSSALQLNMWPEIISSDSTLMKLSEALLDPNRPTYRDLEILLHVVNNHIMEQTDLFPEYQFWSIAWSQKPDRDAAIFLGFLVTSGFSTSCETPHLAVAFAKSHSMLTILTQQHRITKDLWHTTSVDDAGRYDFIGSIPEMAAQWASIQPGVFNFILDLISEHGATHYDVSTLLLLYICCHQTCECNTSCILERLLNLGASANGPNGAFVTPLQIAVACWDLNGIEKLLAAGAKPNALGQNGSRWAQHTFMERFNHLHRTSSLHIITHFECEYKRDLMDEYGLDETTRQKIVARLLESGAVEIA